MAFTFAAMVAWDAVGKQAVKSTSFQVYAMGDTGFVTPLPITDPFGTPLPGNILNSGTVGVFPEFKQADNPTVRITDAARNYIWTVTSIVADDSVAGYVGNKTTAAAAAVRAATASVWQSSTSYTLNQPVINPTGDLMRCTTAHTSTATYDSTKFTLNATDANGATGAALSATFARVVVPSGLVGGADCTTAIQTAATKAQTDGVPLLIPRAANGLPYKMSATLQAWTGARIIGQGAVLDFLTDGTATGRGLFIGSATGAGGVSDVQIHGLKFICSNAVARNGVYGLISMFDSTDVLIQDCWIGNSTAKSGGESTGIFTSNCTDLRIIRPKVQNTLADGVHISRATQRFVVDHAVVIGAADDGIGVVSNRQDGAGPIYGPCRYGQIIAPIILNSTPIGNGVALVGAQDMDVTGIIADGLPNAALVVAQANYGGIINAARNTIKGVTAVNCTFTSGTVRITDSPGTVVTGLNVTACKAGVQLINSPDCIISAGMVATTGGDYGVYADTNSTRALISNLNLAGNGATGYKVYRGTAAGAENVLVATLGKVATYTDTGAAGSAATVPASNTAGVSAPAVTLGATATTGGTFAAGTYYWKVTAITSKGETLGSNEVSATLAVNGTQVLNWGAIINAILLQGANSLDAGNIKA